MYYNCDNQCILDSHVLSLRESARWVLGLAEELSSGASRCWWWSGMKKSWAIHGDLIGRWDINGNISMEYGGILSLGVSNWYTLHGFHGYCHWYGISIWDINMGVGIQWGFNKQDIPIYPIRESNMAGWKVPQQKNEVFILMEKSTTINYFSPLNQKHLIAGWLLFFSMFLPMSLDGSAIVPCQLSRFWRPCCDCRDWSNEFSFFSASLPEVVEGHQIAGISLTSLNEIGHDFLSQLWNRNGIGWDA